MKPQENERVDHDPQVRALRLSRRALCYLVMLQCYYTQPSVFCGPCPPACCPPLWPVTALTVS